MRFGVAESALVMTAWALNVPFYSGAGGPHWNWRLEHGRIRVAHRPEPANPQSFYVAANSEGLRWAPEWRRYAPGDWTVNVPLWALLPPWLALAAWGRLGRTRGRDGEPSRAQ